MEKSINTKNISNLQDIYAETALKNKALRIENAAIKYFKKYRVASARNLEIQVISREEPSRILILIDPRGNSINAYRDEELNMAEKFAKYLKKNLNENLGYGHNP